MGFPSPAQDYVERQISLDELCITRPSASYFMRSDSHYPAVGILKDALLELDSSVKPVDGSLVIASPDGELILCRLNTQPSPAMVSLADGKLIHRTTGDDYDERMEIFGVVVWVINDVRCSR